MKFLQIAPLLYPSLNQRDKKIHRKDTSVGQILYPFAKYFMHVS